MVLRPMLDWSRPIQTLRRGERGTSTTQIIFVFGGGVVVFARAITGVNTRGVFF